MEIKRGTIERNLLELGKRRPCNINLVTPTHYTPEIIRGARARARASVFRLWYNRSGYEKTETPKC